MNGANLHLAVNHFPVIGTIIGLIVLIAGYFLKDTKVRNVAFGIFVLTAIATIPAFFSGESAEHIIKEQPGFEEAYVEEHEEAALWGMIFIQLLGVVSIAVLVLSMRNNPFYKHVSLFTLALALFTLVVIARVTHSGGEVTHPEVRGLFGGKPLQEKSDKESDD